MERLGFGHRVRVNFRLNARLKVTGSMLGSMLEIRVNVRNFQGSKVPKGFGLGLGFRLPLRA